MKQVLADHCTLNFRDRIRKSNRDYSSLNNFFRYEFRRKIRKYLFLMSKLWALKIWDEIYENPF